MTLAMAVDNRSYDICYEAALQAGTYQRKAKYGQCMILSAVTSSF